MNGSDAEQEINRIEQELDAKSPPPGKPPVSQANSEGKISSQKNQSMDAVLIGVVLLLGIGATFALGESLTRAKDSAQCGCHWRCCGIGCWVWSRKAQAINRKLGNITAYLSHIFRQGGIP